MSERLGLFLAILLVAGCIAVLLAIIRFSIISSRRTRGAKGRLHRPNLAEVEAKWNIKLPAALEALYASALVESAEQYLAAPGADREHAWHFYKFIPLTVRDLSESLKIAKVPGLPIAIDGDKGAYYLPFAQLKEGATPPVLLRTPDQKGQDVEIAASVEELMKFERRGAPTE
jgi:hypothetical protein